MRSINTTSVIAAPRSAVWAVLADFPNVADWNTGVKKSFSTSDANNGIGAQRHCDIAPAGELSETIRKWEPETMMAISIDSARKMPINSALGTFTLEDSGESTSVRLDFEYQPRFGPIGNLMGPLLDKQFAKSFDGYMTDLQAAVQTAAPSTETNPNPESDITMTVQIIIMAARSPDSDDYYAAYAEVAVPIMVGAGGNFTGQYGRIDDLVGEDGPEAVAIMEFVDEAAVHAAFKSPEYQAAVPDRDKAFERFNVILAATPPTA